MNLIVGEVTGSASKLGSSLSMAFNTVSGAVQDEWSNPQSQKSMIGFLSDLWNSDGLEQSIDKAQRAFEDLRYSKDMAGIVTRFIVGVVIAYKTSQYAMLRWRGWTTGYYVNKFMQNRAYLGQQNSINSIDNPGQRFQEDPDKFTQGAVQLTTSVQSAIITFTSFSTALLALGPFIGIPGGYLGMAILHAGILTGGMLALAWKMPNVQRELQMREADLRKAIDKVTENASSIALNKTEETELELIKKRLRPAMRNSVREIGISLRLNMFSAFFNNSTIPIPYLIGAVSIANGTATMGTVMTINYAFNSVSSAVAIVANNVRNLSYMLATAGRIYMNDQSIDLQHYLAEEKRQQSLKVRIPTTPPRMPA